MKSVKDMLWEPDH